MTKPPDPRLNSPAAKWGRANGWRIDEVYYWDHSRVIRVWAPNRQAHSGRPFHELESAWKAATKGSTT